MQVLLWVVLSAEVARVRVWVPQVQAAHRWPSHGMVLGQLQGGRAEDGLRGRSGGPPVCVEGSTSM